MTGTVLQPIIVIGAGTMGRGIAQIFAQSGYDAYLNDAIPKALNDGITFIQKMLDRAVEKGTMHADEARLLPTQRRYNAAGLSWDV